MELPSRYLRENTLCLVTDEDLSSKPGGAVVNGKTNQKVIWNLRPRWRLIQIYSIQFVKSGTEDIEMDQICGTIKINMYDEVFKRETGKGYHDIDAEGFVRLSGPDCPKRACDYVTIHPKLYRGNRPGDFFHPNSGFKYEDAEGNLLEDYDNAPGPVVAGIEGIYLSVPVLYEKRPCDELITEKIETTCGTMVIAYAILTDAAECYLSIKLLNWRGDGSGVHIYGRVVASDTLCNHYSGAKSFVFDINKDEKSLYVQEGQNIQLQRPMNVVPMGHVLKLDICIYHKNKTASRDSDTCILKSKIKFGARCGAEERGLIDRREIYGKSCKFEVTAHWRPYWSLPL